MKCVLLSGSLILLTEKPPNFVIHSVFRIRIYTCILLGASCLKFPKLLFSFNSSLRNAIMMYDQSATDVEKWQNAIRDVIMRTCNVHTYDI